MDERKRRSKMLRSLSVKKRRFFYQQHLAEIRPVLFEAENENGFMYGFTDNYIKVRMKYDSDLINEVSDVSLEGINSDGEMIGKSLQFPISGFQFENAGSFQRKTVNRKL